MKRTVSLFSAVRGCETRDLFPTRDAAVRAVLAFDFAVDAIHGRGGTLNAMIDAAHAEVDELTGTFRGKTKSRYLCVPARVPDGWTPTDLLDVPATFEVVWMETDSACTRLMALQLAFRCNATSPKRSWCVVLELGDELPSDGYDVRVQDGVGVASTVANHPVRVVRPTAAEKAKVFAMAASKDAAVA